MYSQGAPSSSQSWTAGRGECFRVVPFHPLLSVTSIASMTLSGKPNDRTTFSRARVTMANAGREAGCIDTGRRGIGRKLWRLLGDAMVEHGAWLWLVGSEVSEGLDSVVNDWDGDLDAMNMSDDEVVIELEREGIAGLEPAGSVLPVSMGVIFIVVS